MRTERSRWSRAAEIIAEDMVELALKGEQDASHFPLPANVIIDSLSPEVLVKVVRALRELPEGSIPYGWTLLFMLPRKIPVTEKRAFFRDVLSKLLHMRRDFSQRESMELEHLPYNIPAGGEELPPSDYRKLVFLLDNLNELRIPIYRGWGFDAFSYDGRFYRVYNLGTLEDPKYVFLSGRLLNSPRANVFGHIKVPEKVDKTVINGIEPDRVYKLAEREVSTASNLETFEDKIEYILKRWENFLGVSLPPDYAAVQPRTRKIRPEMAEKYKEAIYVYVMEVILGPLTGES